MTEKSHNITPKADIAAEARQFVIEAAKSDTSDLSAYVGGDRTFRDLVRKSVESEIHASIRNDDLVTGKALLSLQARILGSGPDKSDTPDVSAIVTQMVMNHLKSAERLANGDFTVDGGDKPDMSHLHVTFTVESDIEGFVMPLPTVGDITVKVGRKTKDHDIQPMIARVYNEVGHVGTFLKVSDIRRRIAKFHDNTDKPCSCGASVDSGWDGRISAALFGKNPPNGLEPVDKGHVRYAEFGAKGAIMSDSTVTPGKSDKSDSSDS